MNVSRSERTSAEPQVGVACPACGTADGLASLYTLQDIPVQSTLLMPDRTAALGFPTGEMDLTWCPSCGFAFNARFDPGRVDYGQGYEDAQGASPTFAAFAMDLARGWIDRYDLRGRHLVEIGCGKGDFLRLICAEGDCTGTGFDPAFAPGRGEDLPGLTFRAETFTDADVPVAADFLICRHTLEHVGDVAGFLRLMRDACGESRTIRLGFEVPDLRRILAEGAFWDIYYEHAAYFTAGSLARAFARAGLDVLNLARVYGDQYLIVEARPGFGPDAGQAPLPPLADDLDETAVLVERFRDIGVARIAAWRDRFADWKAQGLKVALWGSGSKAVGFLTTIGDPGIVTAVVDINPARQGRYMPGCAMPIVAPEALALDPPDIVIVMNAIYRTEITDSLHAMSLAPLVLTTDDEPPTADIPLEARA